MVLHLRKTRLLNQLFFFDKTNCLTLSDDSGFTVEWMENFPGVKTARVAKEMGGEQQVVNYIFEKNPNKQKISATFHCCISLVGHKVNQTVTGKVGGFIISNKTGNGGFGYDPYFIPSNSKRTFAGMGLKEKLILSHRFEAFRILSTTQK